MTKKIKKITKYILIPIVILLGLICALYLYIDYDINQRTNITYSFEMQNVNIDTSNHILKRGAHLLDIKGCTDCHGSDLSGKIFLDQVELGRISASNLTKGKGGLPPNYSYQDWINALRHGIGKDGKPLLFMPSHESTFLSKKDIDAIISYCQQIPSIDNCLPKNKLGPLVKVLTYFGKMPLLSVEMIDHNRPITSDVSSAVGISQGAYLSVSCAGCHRSNMQGGDPLAPGMSKVPSITNSGNLKNYSSDQFLTALRTGLKPTGQQMKDEDMPWKMTSKYTDDEIQSLYLYLKSLD